MLGSSASERHVRCRRHAILFQVWHYAHLPLFLGIGVAGVGFERMISLQSGGRLTGGEAWVLCTAVAVSMAALISIGATSESSQKRRNRTRYLWAQYGLIGIAGFLGFTAVGFQRSDFGAGLSAACTAQTLLGRSAILAPKLVSRKASYPVPILAQPLEFTERP